MEKIFSSKKILLTRSLKESQEFKKLLLQESFSGEVIIFPLLEIKYLKPDIEMEKYDVLVSTSVHAIKKYKDQIKKSNIIVFSVGQRSFEFLLESGVKQIFRSEKVNDLIMSLEKFLQKKRYRTIYLRGNDVSLDITKHLKNIGHQIEEKVVYRQIMKQAKEEVQEILDDTSVTGIAMFSEKSVEFLVKNCSNIPLDKTFFCFSEKIEKKVKNLINERIKCITISRPNITNMAEMIVSNFPK